MINDKDKIKTITAAQFDGTDWMTIQLINFESDEYITRVQKYSQRSSLLHGIFINANCIGNVILDKPQIMFLHGVRYDRKEE